MYTTPLYCTGALYTFSYTVCRGQSQEPVWGGGALQCGRFYAGDKVRVRDAVRCELIGWLLLKARRSQVSSAGFNWVQAMVFQRSMKTRPGFQALVFNWELESAFPTMRASGNTSR